MVGCRGSLTVRSLADPSHSWRLKTSEGSEAAFSESTTASCSCMVPHTCFVQTRVNWHWHAAKPPKPGKQNELNADQSSSKHSDVQTSKSKDPNYQRTTVYLPKKLHRELRAAAIGEGREMSDVIAELVEQWLKSRQ